MKRRFMILVTMAILSIGVLTASSCIEAAIRASSFRNLLYYTVLDVTYVDGEFEGADFGKKVRLANGMVFEFTTYNYAYAYNPDTVVFVNLTSKPYRYKLLIEDAFYDVIRVQ